MPPFRVATLRVAKGPESVDLGGRASKTLVRGEGTNGFSLQHGSRADRHRRAETKVADLIRN
jgi:hypothetical protein